MDEHIKCVSCKYARVDEYAPGNGTVTVQNKKDKTYRRVFWKGIECTNPDSVYHKSLLNIDVNGNKWHRIVWGGCLDGKRRCG